MNTPDANTVRSIHQLPMPTLNIPPERSPILPTAEQSYVSFSSANNLSLLLPMSAHGRLMLNLSFSVFCSLYSLDRLDGADVILVQASYSYIGKSHHCYVGSFGNRTARVFTERTMFLTNITPSKTDNKNSLHSSFRRSIQYDFHPDIRKKDYPRVHYHRDTNHADSPIG